jgi:hypothetical protein
LILQKRGKYTKIKVYTKEEETVEKSFIGFSYR